MPVEREQLRQLFGTTAMSARVPREPKPHGSRLPAPGTDRRPGRWAWCPGCHGSYQPPGVCQTHGLCGFCHDDDGVTPRPRLGRAFLPDANH